MSKQAQIDYYEDLLSRHGDSPLALDWNSRESQRLRHKVFKEIFVYGRKTSGISILDIGCGFGDLYGFFRAEGLLHRNRVSYTGYDLSFKLLEKARKKYPDAKFELKDILEDRWVPKFDYVFCSGVFNILASGKDEHLNYVKEMLSRMYDLAGCGMAVNFLSEGALPISDPEGLNAGRYFYFNPEEIMRYCRFICSRFIVRHDYHPGDFTVYLLKA